MADGGPVDSSAQFPKCLPLRPASAYSPELMLWLSPAFPVGAFAYSHGLERLAEARTITERRELEQWIASLAVRGSLHNDLILLSVAWQAVRRGDMTAFDEAASLAACLQPGAERRLETLSQGQAFVETIERIGSGASTARLIVKHSNAIAYPISVAAASADRGIPLAAVCEAYAIAFASSLVSAAIRLSIVGQFDGQAVLADILPVLQEAARSAVSSTLAELGSSMFLSDIASLEHETQHTRLFRS